MAEAKKEKNDGIPFLKNIAGDDNPGWVIWDCGPYTDESGFAPMYDDGGRIDVVRMVMVAEYREPYNNYVLDSDMTLGCFLGGFCNSKLVTPQDVYLYYFGLPYAHAYVDEETGHVRIKARIAAPEEKQAAIDALFERRKDMGKKDGEWVSLDLKQWHNEPLISSLPLYPSVHGRHTLGNEESPSVILGFSGAYSEFITDSHEVTLGLETESSIEDPNLVARVAVFVDDEEEPADIRTLTEEKTEIKIKLYESSFWKEFHKVRIEKISEAAFGMVKLTTFKVEDDSRVHGTLYKNRKIEFIGDSITCGYGVEASNELDIFKTCEENCEKAYAIRTARALKADYHLVSWSGIGIITNWVPEDVNEPLEEILMPTLYKYSTKDKDEEWDNSKFVPDLIIINLGTNDDSYTRKIPERVAYFGDKYGLFLDQVHEANPESAIMAILGTMGQNLCEEEAKQVDLFKERHPDVKITFVTMPEQDASLDGYGADYHPSESSQKKAAAYLTEKVKDFMNW